MLNLVIADDHTLVRQGVRALLERSPDFQIVGEASDGQEALDLVQRLVPDVLIIDVAMPHLNGIEATDRVQALGLPTRVVILSMHRDESLVLRALRHGANAYVLKQSVVEELYLAVRTAARGETYLSPAVAGPVLQGLLTNRDLESRNPIEALSPRERQVLQLIVEGKSNLEVAQLLRISVKTVEKHRGSLMGKLEVHDVTALVHLAIKYGLIYVRE